MRIQMLILAFLFLGAFFIISNGNLHLANPSEAGVFASAYSNWIGSILSNAVTLTGRAVDMKWLPS